MEGVEHPHRVGQLGAQRGRVATERIKRREADAGPPRVLPVADPARVGTAGAARHDIEQPGGPTRGQVDDAGDVLRRAGGGGPQPRGLIHAEPHHAGEPVRVVDERGAVLTDRAHHGAPAHPQLQPQVLHGVAVLAEPPDRPHPGPLGQRRLRPDRLGPLAPGPPVAPRLLAAPDPLAPHQRHRTPAAGNVAHHVLASAVRYRHHATALAAAHR